jgi:ribosome-associated protein
MSVAPQDHDEAHEDDPFDGRPSKSARKREMHALQSIGEELVALPADKLARLDIPDELRVAIADARRFNRHEARRRQMQYIGRIMRGIDPEPLRAALDAFNGVSKAEVARHHRLERLREDFLADEQVAGRIVAAWPNADLQHLRTLRRNALRERELHKPPRSYRELFRILRELDAAAVADNDTPDPETP